MGFPRQEHWSGLPFPSPEDITFLLKSSYVNAVNIIYNLFNLLLFSLSIMSDSVLPNGLQHTSLLSFITLSQSLLRLMSVELTILCTHLILSPSSPPALNLSQHQDLFQ